MLISNHAMYHTILIINYLIYNKTYLSAFFTNCYTIHVKLVNLLFKLNYTLKCYIVSVEQYNKINN